MLTVNDLLAALQDIAADYGHIPVAVTVQRAYPVTGNVASARVTGPAHAPKLHLFANTDEYGPSFNDEDDQQNIETIL